MQIADESEEGGSMGNTMLEIEPSRSEAVRRRRKTLRDHPRMRAFVHAFDGCTTDE